jgi:type IV pilus assembly protein PilM
MNDTEEAVAVDTHLPEDAYSPMQAGGSMSQSTRGEVVSCRRCQTDSVASHKFCPECGEPLWEPCVHCGTVGPAGERFCSVCGANLAAAVHQQTEQFEMNLLTVEQLQAEGRYDEAIALLGPISSVEHPRLNHHAKAATEFIKRLTAERQQGMSQAEESCRQGRLRFDAHDYSAVVRLLEDIPVGLRNEEFQNLLAEAVRRREELATLGGHLRAAIAGKRISAALPMIARLLELKPDHAQARQLADKVQKRFAQAAAAKIAKCRYEEAVKLLDEVPESLRSAETAALAQRASELAWIAWDLRNAAVVDAPLLAVAARLKKLSPGDARSEKLAAEMRRRYVQAEKDGRLAPPPWASPPPQTPLGFPVDWLNGLGRIAPGTGLDRALLATNPGCFAVACGLALQGLGQAHVQLDLHINPRQTAIGTLTQLLRLKSSGVAWGLDIGSTSVKAVKLAWHKRQGTATIETAVRIDYKKPLSQAASEDEEKGMIGEALTALLAEHPLKAEQVCVGVPGRLVLPRLFHLPDAGRAKMATMVQFEARRVVPTRLDQLVWDFQALSGDEPGNGTARSRAKNGSVPVLFAAARRKLLQKRFDLLQRAGISVDAAQSECIAAYNFLMFQRAGGPQAAQTDDAATDDAADPGPAATDTLEPRWPVMLVDVGGDGSNLLIASPARLWVRHLGFGGYSITRALVQEFNLTASQAEELKRNPASAPSLSGLYRALAPVLDDFRREIEVSLAAYAKAEDCRPAQQLLGTGGGFQLHALLAWLRTLA